MKGVFIEIELRPAATRPLLPLHVSPPRAVRALEAVMLSCRDLPRSSVWRHRVSISTHESRWYVSGINQGVAV